jgi:hypothetical protein
MANLWTQNEPRRFWQCRVDLPQADWELAVQRAAPILGLPDVVAASLTDAAASLTTEDLLALTLGEGQFGADRWRLSPAKRAYYALKPLLPRALTRVLRRLYSPPPTTGQPVQPQRNPTRGQMGWPAETRYAEFQWEVMRQLAAIRAEESLPFTHFWPNGKLFAFVLTHDVETEKGQSFVREVAGLDESFGFRSSFNFVPERYPLDYELMDELRERGFEIGVHGLRHDGKLFWSQAEFMRRAERINRYLHELEAVGFRAPLTHRHAEWMQALEIEYDLSFFDTDPYEPMPGGTMSLWPFAVGHFIELPYTLVQDYVLAAVLQQRTPGIWLDKVDLIESYHGMVLLNSHPDYMRDDVALLEIYREFLYEVRERGGFWHALPRDVARWWRARLDPDALAAVPPAVPAEAIYHPSGPEVRIQEPEVDVVPGTRHRLRLLEEVS